MKRFWTASAVVFVIVFALEYIFHGVVLKNLYTQTASIWRPQADMGKLFWLMWVAYLIFSVVFVLIYTKGYEPSKSDPGQGFRYGFWVGILTAVPCSLIYYAVLPIPVMIAVWWFAAGMIECIVSGFVVSLICKPIK